MKTRDEGHCAPLRHAAPRARHTWCKVQKAKKKMHRKTGRRQEMPHKGISPKPEALISYKKRRRKKGALHISHAPAHTPTAAARCVYNNLSWVTRRRVSLCIFASHGSPRVGSSASAHHVARAIRLTLISSSAGRSAWPPSSARRSGRAGGGHAATIPEVSPAA